MLVVAVVGLIFIGLVAVAGFTVMAQRRLRALGMLSAVGAAERHVRLVMVADGAIIGLAAVMAGALIGLLGAVLGTAFAAIAGLAWARSSLGTTFGNIPAADLIAVLIGLPLLAAAGGWLLAGRQPPAIARQPLE